MLQRALTDVRSGHLMDAPITISNLTFFCSIQTGYQAYQEEPTPLNEHDIYECLVHHLLAFPGSACEKTGWVIGWVKGLLEAFAQQQPPLTSLSKRSEMPAPYGDNFLPAIPTIDNQRHSVSNPFCYDPSCPCHEDQENIAEVTKHVSNGLMTSDEASEYVKGKHI